MSSTWTLTARWIFPVDRPPLECGNLTIRDDRIVAVEPAEGRTADVNLGNAAVLPGLVNAHTHLDLTGLRGQIPPTEEFTDWLRAVIHFRRSRSPEQVQQDIRDGLAEALITGTTLIGDISSQGGSWPMLAESPVRAVVFHELLGLPRDRARQAWADFRSWYSAHPATTTCRPGLSPHSPYSVRASLFRLAASFARQHGLPVAIHLAETHAEQDLLDSHQGPFRAFLEELGVWDPDGLVSDVEEILRNNRPISSVLYVHGNYLKEDEFLPPGATLVHCPRTHAVFGHPLNPVLAGTLEGIDGPVRIALGTDSLASNPDLDLLEEARFLHENYPELEGATLLRMATLTGAEALGWEKETGSLQPGKSADLIVIPLPERDEPDPHRLIWASDLPVKKVLLHGRWVVES